ncbi:MAG TPA: MDR family oxidoreductase [Polyangiales bacterium]|nr:MDR family oxidoreductase [Polyangiales bacterium]
MADAFNAVVIEEEAGKARASLKQLTLADLPDHDVLVEVEFSTLNYKDGLVLSGNRSKVARKLPLVAGIDLAGTIVESRAPGWRAGDKVVVNGFGLSESHYGGYARFARVKPEWLVRLPAAFTTEQAMAIGTAGYTAALCVDALVAFGIGKDAGEILVTGAAGGVGSVAIALLAAAGFEVVASTGRPDTHDYLKALGARSFLDRASLSEKGAPLQKERWGGAVDVVGGVTLANLLAQTKYGHAVTACGLAGGADLPATVLPHILRSVALLGVDSVHAPLAKREQAWQRLARDLPAQKLAGMTRVEPMSKVVELAGSILAGQVRGRVVIDVKR